MCDHFFFPITFWLHIYILIGINIFLDGFVPTENLRFRETSLVFKVSETADEEEIKRMCRNKYPDLRKTLGKPANMFGAFKNPKSAINYISKRWALYIKIC